MFPAGIYVICDDGLDLGRDWVAQARLAIEARVPVLQLRVKHAPLRAWVREAREVVACCRAADIVCLVNDRVDVALVVGAHGVHLGDEDIKPEDARRVLPRGAIIGVTVRNAGAAREALEAGADYVGMGPVFATRTKQVAAPVMGLERLQAEVAQSPLPVVAIGGIGLGNVASVARAGAYSAAIVSDLWRAPAPLAHAAALSAAFEEGRAP